MPRNSPPAIAHEADPGPDTRPPWGAVLRALRAAAGVTREGWAARLGYSAKTVQRWEAGTTPPDAEAERAIVALCREKGLLCAFDEGPLRGLTVSAELLRDLLAAARLGPTERPTSPPVVAGGPPTNLPAAFTSFVGRAAELAAVRRLFDSARLVTLAGPGGVGKTRLALEVAGAVRERYPDGVWLVDLAALTGPALVPQVVATVLQVPVVAGQTPADALVAALQPKELLLVLDNCEHLLPSTGVSGLAETLLRACPLVRVLATSRTPLGVGGEALYRVPPMSVPGSGFEVPRPGSATMERETWYLEPEQADAVRLFVERAATADPRFALTAQTAPTVARVCRRLDGIPLAIELAAARVRVLTVEQIDARLDNAIRLLARGSASAPPRQQTLEATLDWSYDLLSEPEQRLFDRLSVFAGGFTLEAAETVCSGDGIERDDVLDLLTDLVDKSLVIRSDPAGTSVARYRLLEPIRQYAWLNLKVAGEAKAQRGRHRDWFLTVAEEAAPELRRPEQAIWLERIEAERDNLRAALEWCRSEAAEAETGARLAVALWPFWEVRGPLGEGRRWLEWALDADQGMPSSLRATAANAAGVLARQHGDLTAASAFFERSLGLAREQDDATAIARSLNNLGELAMTRGDLAAARTFLEESMALWRRPEDQWQLARTVHNLGNVAYLQGDFAAARALFAEVLSTKRASGDRQGTGTALNNLGLVTMGMGDLAGARLLLSESLAIYEELGDRRRAVYSLQGLADLARLEGDYARAERMFRQSLRTYGEIGDQAGVANSLENLGGVSAACDDHARAAYLLGAAEGRRLALAMPIPPAGRAEHEAAVSMVRAGLGDAAFTSAWEAGKAMTVEQAVAYAAGTSAP
jgi:predicted ATPase/Tfp pilus assembly protein PilF/transcriptional regulator with XRE-family HTH domain